jgi:Fic family protein
MPTRQPAGTPSGGEFSAQRHDEGDLDEPTLSTAVSYEDVDWTPNPASTIPRSQRLTYAGPYRAAVTPPIARLDPRIPADAIALVVDASTEIARFDSEMGADIAPFSAILLRSESAASSQIEHLTASAKAIALAEIGDTSKRNARVIAANSEAMTAAIALAETLDEQSIIEMHRTLLAEHSPQIVGKWRDQQVWIGGGSYGPHTAAFVPPRHELVPAAITDLVAFARRIDVPALLQAAIVHAQFETIHPFPDGNGRTGRALIHSLLRRQGLTRSVTVPVSAGLLTDTQAYFDALGAYRTGDIAPIASLMAHASFAAIDNGRTLINELRTSRHRWNEQIVARKSSSVWTVADLVLRQPAVTSDLVQRALNISAPAADNSIGKLVEAGVLTQVSGNPKWGRKWVANDVLQALDDFAARCGRRAL